jgi:zinc/manganese transport system substrate-binding protein
VHVASIVSDPSADPHLYESNAKNAAVVSSAKVVIVNGLGYDDFMSRLLGGSKKAERQVVNAQQILGAADGANPHLWYDIPRVSEVASKITDSYIAVDPAHKNDYQHNLVVFKQSLQPLIQMIHQLKQQHLGAPVAYTEPVAGYLLNDAGLTVKTPEGFAKAIEEGVNPSPADSVAMDALMTSKAVTMLLYNSQATSSVTEHVKDLARQSGVPVIGVSETIPSSEKTYQSWQKDQLGQILKVLESSQ